MKCFGFQLTYPSANGKHLILVDYTTFVYIIVLYYIYVTYYLLFNIFDILFIYNHIFVSISIF